MSDMKKIALLGAMAGMLMNVKPNSGVYDIGEGILEREREREEFWRDFHSTPERTVGRNTSREKTHAVRPHGKSKNAQRKARKAHRKARKRK